MDDLSRIADDLRPFSSSAREAGKVLQAFLSAFAAIALAIETIISHLLSRVTKAEERERSEGRH